MSLYLKYRPRDFKSLVGQEFVKETLRKAVESEKTVGAYLFCGPRGTGKTSSARIMAKAVNCMKPTDGNPCNDCDTCNAINSESLVDVIEIDAASHTGVDNIREIIEKARFNPTHAKFKIYIIDEVHMLSKGAFNALLKILEEPPSYVKFILATTETHKVPETIISRCQRYDMKRISESDIKSRLEYVAGEEGVKVDEKSLNYVAKSSAGGLRNALSLFEQLIIDDQINYDTVIKTMGIVEDDTLEEFTSKLINSDSSIIQDFDEVVSSGKNIKLFFKEIIFYLKDKATEKALKGDNINSYIKVLSILDDTYSKTKNSLDENTTFMIGVLKIVSNYKEETVQAPTKTAAQATPQRVTQAPTPTQTPPPVDDIPLPEPDNISHDDAFDVFGGDDIPMPSSPEPEPSKPAPSFDSNPSYGAPKDEFASSGSFNKDAFVAKIKEAGGKGGLTMGIRGADVFMNGDSLTIKFKTAFALKAVNTNDNVVIMAKALELMGMGETKLDIK